MSMIYKTTLAGRTLTCELGRMAELAGASCLITYGETVVLVCATTSETPRAGIDWFPLSCDYEERFYAVGKIPGSWFRREGRPTEKAILASRLIDRPLRPLFPPDYRNDVAVVATVLSVDQDASPEISAMIGASIALTISDIPFAGPIGAINIGLIGDQLIVNPTLAQREVSLLNLTVASTAEKVMMIEAGAAEVDEQTMLGAIKLAHDENKKIIEFIQEIAQENSQPKREYERHELSGELLEKIRGLITDERMEAAVFNDDKQVRQASIRQLTNEATESICAGLNEEEAAQLSAKIASAMYELEKETVRRMIFHQRKRPDGRGMAQMRDLFAEVDVLPRTHGSGLFKRGQTQVLTVTTLGSSGDTQRLDGLDSMEEHKRYMHHYNFPSYSVGETRPSRGPGRREIGHGALVERALLPVLPCEDDFPYVIRLVSEVLSSNGSTSQASVCGSTLSLMAAGVPILRPVAGISVGMVCEGDEYVLLTDIQGIEDFFGDMDFKVAGTSKGITAIQMDIKVHGLSMEIIENSLAETKRARGIILDECMLHAIEAPRPEISPHAPKIQIVRVAVDQIAEVIGSRGKVIKRIIEESGVEKIDTEDDGRIFVSDKDIEKVKRAVQIIKAIVMVPEVGAVFTGKVTRIMNFGAFVEIAPEKEGLVHISQWDTKRVEVMEDVVKVGDVVSVVVSEIDEQGRLNLSRKAFLDPSAQTTVRRPPKREGQSSGGGGRSPRGDSRPPRGR